MRGFFDSDDSGGMSLPMVDSHTKVGQLPACGKCEFYKGCKSPKLPVAGKGRKDILFVSSHPTEESDKLGKHMAGIDLDKLKAVLFRNNLDLHKDCHLTSALICKPHGKLEVAYNKHIPYCRPNLVNLIHESPPKLIVLLGKFAIRSLISHLWRPMKGDMPMEITGWILRPHRLRDTWVVPTYHPSDTHDSKKQSMANDMMFRHIEAGIKKLDRLPHPNGIPNYDEKITLLHDPYKINKLLKRIIREGKPISFDYETNMKKPDHPKARIACMSVSDGEHSWSFLNTTDIRKQWIRFLVSDVPKTGYNTKFESRWGERIFGVWTKNWIYDGMLTAHILDVRKFATSLKWQAFARLGVPDYDSKIKPYLSSEDKKGGSYTENRVFDAPVDDLLYYCAMDSLLEAHVAESQKRETKRRVRQQCQR